MTLHRRRIGKEVVLAQLGRLLEAEYHEALLPALVSTATGGERLRLALEAVTIRSPITRAGVSWRCCWAE
jgi:hypothetical protein